MNKLIQGEASRITSVIDEVLFAVELLSHVPLPPDPPKQPAKQPRLRHATTAAGKGGKGGSADDSMTQARKALVATLERQQCLETRRTIEQLWTAETRAAKSLGKGPVPQAGVPLDPSVRDAVKGVCRSLRKDAKALEILAAWKAQHARVETSGERGEGKHGDESDDDSDDERRPPPSLDDVRECVADFKVTVATALSTTVEETQSKGVFYEELALRIAELEDDLASIKECLAEEAVKEAALDAKQDKIETLLGAVKQVQTTYEGAVEDIHTQGVEQKSGAAEAFTAKNGDALEAFDAASAAFVKDFEDHSEMETNLRKKHNRSTAEVNALIDRYDAAMLDKLARFKALEASHSKEKKRLAVLEEHFRRVDRDLANEAEEERLIADEEERIRALGRKDHDAAAKIQALYRGNRSRSRPTKSRKGKKGKSAKGMSAKGKKGKKK